MCFKNKQIREFFAAAIIVLYAIGNRAFAAGIMVNGEIINQQGLIVLQMWNCGDKVHEGRYWLDYETGMVGIENGPALGILPCYPYAAALPDRSSASADRDSGSTNGSDSPWEDRMCAMGVCEGVIINPVYQ
jgi:hypothetical protein